MRIAVAFMVALVMAATAFAVDPAPHVRTCDSSQYGDLGRGWRNRAAVAGDVAFIGMRNGYRRLALDPLPQGRVLPLKVVVVVDPNAASTVTIAPRSHAHARLGYNGIRQDGTGVPLTAGTRSVRFEACGSVQSREPWNRGTQFGGYFLVSGLRCVHVDVSTQGKVLRRKLSFGARC